MAGVRRGTRDRSGPHSRHGPGAAPAPVGCCRRSAGSSARGNFVRVHRGTKGPGPETFGPSRGRSHSARARFPTNVTIFGYALPVGLEPAVVVVFALVFFVLAHRGLSRKGSSMRIGVLTSGGDCPGLNAVIRSVVHRAVADHGDTVVGILDGYLGLIEGRSRLLGLDDVRGILAAGGTILGSARVERSRVLEGVQRSAELKAALGIDVLIAIGGDGTMTAAHLFDEAGLPIVGIPKTIDNDVCATDTTFGHDTAVSVATEAMDRLKTTAEAQHQVMVVELMGRHTGWIALNAGMAAGAHGILIPERPFDVEDVCRMIEARFSRGKRFAIVAVAEGAGPTAGTMRFEHGAMDVYGHQRFGGIGNRLAVEITQWLCKDARLVILGHVQRGGTPTAQDRVLATRFGWHAVETVHRGTHGQMTALHHTRIHLVPITEATTRLNRVPADRWTEAGAIL